MIKKIFSYHLSSFWVSSIRHLPLSFIQPHNKASIYLSTRYKFSEDNSHNKQSQSIDQLLTRFMSNKLTMSVSDYSNILIMILRKKETLNLTDNRITILLQNIQNTYKHMKDSQIIETLHYMIENKFQQFRISLYKKLWIQIMERQQFLQVTELTKLFRIVNRIMKFENSVYMKSKYEQIYQRLNNIFLAAQKIVIYNEEEVGKQIFFVQSGFCIKQKCLYIEAKIIVIIIKCLNDSEYKNSTLKKFIQEKVFNEENCSQNLNKLKIKQLKKMMIIFSLSQMEITDSKYINLSQALAQRDYFKDDISFPFNLSTILIFLKVIQKTYYLDRNRIIKKITKQMKDYGIRILYYLFSQRQVIRNDSEVISMVFLKLSRVQIYQKQIYTKIINYYIQNQSKLNTISICSFFKALGFQQKRMPNKDKLMDVFIDLIKARYNQMEQIGKIKISETFIKFQIISPKQITLIDEQKIKKYSNKKIPKKKDQNNDSFHD